MKTVEAIFNEVFNGHKNAITPKVLRYDMGLNYAIELSRGYGVGKDIIYGVTVVNITTSKPFQEHGLSKCFFKYSEAQNYIRKILK